MWARGLRLPGLPVCHELLRVLLEVAAAALLADDDVLDPDPVGAGDDDRGLVGEGHPRLERRLVLRRDEGPLVDVEADRVTHAVAEVLPEPGLLDRRAARSVDLPRERARRRGRTAGLLRGEHRLVSALHLRGRLAAVDGAAEVRAVAVDDAAEVEQHRPPLRQRVVPGLG